MLLLVVGTMTLARDDELVEVSKLIYFPLLFDYVDTCTARCFTFFAQLSEQFSRRKQQKNKIKEKKEILVSPAKRLKSTCGTV